ncbi:MAG: hypothetical protein DHS20C02_05370 [Micavibrio sp.]|nr:MAG: hypothetical protein DHS20C02_05370 [Micavibrio sp.]
MSQPDHTYVTIYDNEDKGLTSALGPYLQGAIKVLTPKTPETLDQAAKNSALVFIALNESNLVLGGQLQKNRLVAADIVGIYTEKLDKTDLQLMAMGFDMCLGLEDAQSPEFKDIMAGKLLSGNRRLSGLFVAEEQRRLSDALSCAPASFIVFDADKRIAFVSEHYYRAYPKSAPRLGKGLSVYDAFDMMSAEEQFSKDDPRYEELKTFWHTLEGNLDFVTAGGSYYRLKAARLPNKRGYVVTAAGITQYKKAIEALEKEIEALRS